MQMRRATDTDVAEIARLRRAAEEWLESRGIRQWEIGEMPVERIAAEVERGEWWVSPEDDHVGGALRFIDADPDIWPDDDVSARYVHGLVIDRCHAGNGYGEALLAWARQRATDEGCAYLRLDCVEWNDFLRGYYARLGFVEVGRCEATPPWYPLTLLQKRL